MTNSFPVLRRCSLALIASASAAALAPDALAQKQAEPVAVERTALPIPVGLERLDLLPVTLRLSRGAGEGGGTVRGPGCPQTVASHTDASFTGGSYTAQAGFAQNEIAAASYVLPASAFPIKVELLEFIMVTSQAVVQTTTEYTILVWDGPPNSGPPVFEYASNDLDLPHARIGPGTAGVNIQVAVDPGDPEQIYVYNNSGTNTFSIGLRIDHHNQQSGSGCGGSTDIPSNRNAFPCTDVSGLSQGARNWLFGVNCGIFGCPPNGGWSTFSGLNILCRPSGDWVMRATWSSINCEPDPTGACCAPIGSCTVTTQANCAAGSSWSQGGVCSPNTCTQPTARCCLPNGSCQILLQSACTAQQGSWTFGQTCAAACPQPTGACCFGTSCQVMEPGVCSGFGGTFIGINVACGAGGTCPLGACCLPDGTCASNISNPACTGLGGTFQGVGTSCSPNNCPQPTGACCSATNFCFPLTQASCSGIPGATWRGPLTLCEPNPCGAAQTGACCIGGTCTVVTAAQCTGANARFAGVGTSCNAPGNNLQPCCRADFNQDQNLGVPDIFAFLSAWFAGDSTANFDGDGAVPTVPDIFAFLSAWFAGCS